MLVSGSNGCIPIQKKQETDRAAKLDEHQIPSTPEIVRMYEERGGTLTRDATIGHDPLAAREDLWESREFMFHSTQPTFETIFADVIQGRFDTYIKGVLYFYNTTIMLQM